MHSKFISFLLAGATLGAAAPALADPWRGNERRSDRSHHVRFDGRGHHEVRDHRWKHHGPEHRIRVVERHPVVIVQRPYVLMRPAPVHYVDVTYAPSSGIVLGALIGAVIGGIHNGRH